MGNYFQQLQALKNGTREKDPPKEKKPIAKVSEKKKKELKEEKPYRDQKEEWFETVRKQLTGTCQCGCAEPSSKNDDLHFRSSCCHIFPKSIFKSIQFHPLNYVERNFWNGCHTNMDNQSMDKWVNMADWEDIREKFIVLSPLLTRAEKATNFYTHLERLVNEDNRYDSIILASLDEDLKTVIVEKA